jgi:hypothetical protein
MMPYLLKARTMEPEKQLLLANGSETTFVSRQRLRKHVPAATDTHATREILFKRRFLLDTCKRVIKRTIEARRGSWEQPIREDLSTGKEE